MNYTHKTPNWSIEDLSKYDFLKCNDLIKNINDLYIKEIAKGAINQEEEFLLNVLKGFGICPIEIYNGNVRFNIHVDEPEWKYIAYKNQELAKYKFNIHMLEDKENFSYKMNNELIYEIL